MASSVLELVQPMTDGAATPAAHPRSSSPISPRAPHQTIGKAIGLAVFASDALSSTAYATQEILAILAAAGAAALVYAFPISLAIIALLIIVSVRIDNAREDAEMVQDFWPG